MEALLYFVLWGGFILLMMRFGFGAQVMGRSHGHGGVAKGSRGDAAPELRWIPQAKDRDPVCGKTVTTASAKPSVHAGHVFYFCSRECREVFEAAPDIYVGGGNSDSGRPKGLEHSHA